MSKPVWNPAAEEVIDVAEEAGRFREIIQPWLRASRPHKRNTADQLAYYDMMELWTWLGRERWGFKHS